MRITYPYIILSDSGSHLAPCLEDASADTRYQMAGQAIARDTAFDKLVNEELSIQRRNLPVNGGLPSCVTLMDNFLLCFGDYDQFV